MTSTISASCKARISSLAPATKIWQANALPESALFHLHLTPNPDSAVNSSFKLGSIAQTSIGLSGLSAAYLHSVRKCGKNSDEIGQEVYVDARHAVLEFHSEAWYTIDGKRPVYKLWDPIAGIYATKDGHIRIHTNFPHHRRGVLSILSIQDTPQVTRETVAASIIDWNAVQFESEAAARGMCATAMRSFDEWDKLPQAQALFTTPPVEIMKIGEAPKRQMHVGSRPLEDIRVLDFSRVLAGPVCGRTLAYHGADVLLITSPELSALPLLDADTSRGKRTTQLDLTEENDCARLTELTMDADVFMQAYRPGGLAAKGFSADAVALLRPGIVYASLSAWGWDGPWKDRRGFDSLVQTATGFNLAEGDAYATHTSDAASPRPLPMQVLDHAAGYLLAFGVNTALARTITEGGSYEVRVSLAAVGIWVRSLGRIDPELAFEAGQPLPSSGMPENEEIGRLMVNWPRQSKDEQTKREIMSAIKHAAILSGTPVKQGNDSVSPAGLNEHLPEWLVR